MGPLAVIVIIAFSICGLIGYFIKTKNQERLKLIEKGIDPNEGINVSEYNKQKSLRSGILFVSFGLGIFCGIYLSENYEMFDLVGTYLASLLFFGGIGFLINYLIIRNWNIKK